MHANFYIVTNLTGYQRLLGSLRMTARLPGATLESRPDLAIIGSHEKFPCHARKMVARRITCKLQYHLTMHSVAPHIPVPRDDPHTVVQAFTLCS